TLAIIGDLGGQGYCRPKDGGYRILASVEAAAPTLVVANGDLIYADGACTDTGPDGVAQLPGDFISISDAVLDWTNERRVKENLHKHWRYNRGDANFVSLLASAPLIAQWDDHEVVNDMGPWESWLTGDPARPGYPALYAAGREAFFAWNPIERHPEEPERIYRSLRWGQHVELFVVDARSYRSPNPEPDGPEKTLLGAAQLAWLTEAVTQSDATWKIVSVDVPMAIPTGSGAWKVGRDGWASGVGDPTTPEGETDISAQTGYERELGVLLRAFDAAEVQGLVFVTTDVHFAETLRYSVDLDGDGVPLTFHELVTGPLRAWMGEPPPLDPSFKPEALYAEGMGSFFSVLEVSEDGATLTATVRGTDGAVRPGSELLLHP
ncbi:MAG: alkaline phosphatase D family protein, partial [Alphaproteobacteria bacterium]|nr:alkaline phosphatase D family protein [Alphaproteobacteria bacterium]